MDIQAKTLRGLEFDRIREKLAGFAKFPQSRQLCLNAPVYDDFEEIKSSLRFTREAKYILDNALEIPIEYIADIEEIQKNVIGTYLTEEELVDIAKTLRSSRVTKKFLAENLDSGTRLHQISRDLIYDKVLEDKIFSTFDEALNIKPDATPELLGLYSSLKDTERNLKQRVSELLNSPEFTKHLQDSIYTTRDDRIVFQVMASSKSKVPGIVHDVSATSKTFFIEPEQIVPLNNKIRELKAKIHSECVKILSELTREVKTKIVEIKLSESLLAQIDFHFAKARYAVKLHAVEPELADDKVVVIENMKHPLLIGTVEHVVPNNFQIGKDYKSVIITGSNTGGKTVAIKTIGLFLLMTRAGFYLPCTAAKIHPFKKVFADIGDEQSILQSLSTFSSHMTCLIDILHSSDDDSFVILDEICAGTDPLEGAVLAECILEKFSSKGVTSTITTHYGELKALEYVNPYFKNASVEFDTSTLRPTYKLLIGIPGLSNAISISSNLGLDRDIVEKAKNIIVSQKDPSIVVVEKLQETQQKLSQNLEEAELLKEDSLNLKKEYEDNLSEIKKDKKKTIKIIKDKFNYELLDAKSEIKSILDELRKEKSEKIARRAYARLAQLEQGYRSKIDEIEDKEKYEAIDWTNIKPNDTVMLKELHQPVVVLSLPDKNNNVLVQMGNIRTKMKTDKLAPFDNRAQKKANPYQPSKLESFELRRVNVASTLDIRGFRVEDALDNLEFYLDKASLANLHEVQIIHGHGTGALKSAVRDYLSTSPYVAKFRPGEDAEGGDGVSIVDLN